MNLAQLNALGFDIVCGQIDRQGKNYGRMVGDDAVLTDEGHALVAELREQTNAPEAAPAETKAAAKKTAPAKKAAKPAPAPAPAAPGTPESDDAASLANELNALTGG